MFLRTVKLVLLLGLLLGGTWFAFVVPLGRHTLSEHIDAISQTPEARSLIHGTRSTLRPLMRELRDRVLGEHVEAPTAIPRSADEPRVMDLLEVESGAGAVSQPGDTKLPGRD